MNLDTVPPNVTELHPNVAEQWRIFIARFDPSLKRGYILAKHAALAWSQQTSRPCFIFQRKERKQDGKGWDVSFYVTNIPNGYLYPADTLCRVTLKQRVRNRIKWTVDLPDPEGYPHETISRSLLVS